MKKIGKENRLNERRGFYIRVAEHFLPRLMSFQYSGKDESKRGCFFYPYYGNDLNFANARWQEAVLTLAWFCKNKKKPYVKNVTDGIDFWCSLQNKDGSLPEYCKKERGFSPTAFSTLAVSESIMMLGMKNDAWMDCIEKAGRWLVKNNERILINQEACAALTLQMLSRLLESNKFSDAAEKKLDIVLDSQSEDGHYTEKCGCDVGYSTLTLEMIGRFYQNNPRGDILESAKRFADFFNSNQNGTSKNIRKTNWIITDGFEIFSKHVKEARVSLEKIFSENLFDYVHIPDERHVCTDLYRHCWAQENVTFGMQVNYRRITEPETTITKSNYTTLRKIGIHRFTWLRYFWCQK